MVIKENPFTSSIYNTHWSDCFYQSKTLSTFNFLNGIAFTKNKYLPLYFNAGKGKSYGMSYTLKKSNEIKDFAHKTIFIYDVLDYFKIDKSISVKGLGLKTLFSNEGYLVELESFDNFDSYLNNQFNSKQRHKLRSSIKKLESSHDIAYEWYHGEITKDTFTSLLNAFYDFINVKYENKKEKNSHLKTGVRSWYNKMLFQMINEKKASFFVIKDGGIPISVNLCYHADNVMFGAAALANFKYKSYGMGSIAILKSIQWAFDNDVSFFDMSKESFGYKHRWATKKYIARHHMFYDKKSLIAVSLVNFISILYKMKQLKKRIRVNS
ncbi:GNAT family N-acetyltransferase [Allomuricauda sp. R78024]|uniref:GNAT family N-acetyltransferase n=1 Tax=Allomuricauda sp. R78024 TaxID=3093867 RepID=UPI0037CC1199